MTPPAFTPLSLHVRTLNARGFNIPEHRTRLLRELWSYWTSVATIQDTHFKLDSEQALKDKRFPSVYFASHPLGKKAGVAILSSQGTPFDLLDQKTDLEGRYLFVKGHINSQIYTFATIYAPNSRQHIFITKTLRLLANFSERLLILGGDLNASLDTSRGRSDSTIGHITWSDHAPVSLQMTSPLLKPKERTWRLNESLLMDEEVRTTVREALTNYFKENTNPDTGRTTMGGPQECDPRGSHLHRSTQEESWGGTYTEHPRWHCDCGTTPQTNPQ
ncbi:Hypothetical predicted protein [Pelobates cultripes]|uniref:Endonuclease/exonuclease/phosphatase domain-containing protein n=1 Tax=Pelobates cultripes TaxID=61616 RepID=A0AAD1SSN0_PELCU|nr:Hypothetical predicted protein [Pelobates cultripes]